ncbi:protein-disulfide reductase DsbD [Rickettsiella endosymbiont of Aleochara curtula]|uniref:protein-disulfide reductase DsbD n=1 Tax=Rickettsiella endosymbiont of Aleochara curtula TaxID=3077936 RepID=UPI00313BF982
MFNLIKFFKVLLVGLSLGAGILPAYASQQALPVDQVFQVSVQRLNDKTLTARWTIKPGYYLYRDKIHFESTPIRINSVVFPKGTIKHNQFIGKYEVYQGHVVTLLKFVNPLPDQNLDIMIHYQGCAIAGFCYPPVVKHISLTHAGMSVSDINQNSVDIGQNSSKNQVQGSIKTASEQSKILTLLAGHNIFWTLLSFFGFGLLLSLTPCVLPLIPVLSAIILGQKHLTTAKAFSLSITYVLAMAFTYAIAGVFAGLAGSYLQAFLQSPWVIIIVCALFVALAFSLFGFYELRLPESWHEKLIHITNRQQGGNYIGVALMGCLSTLVISPCITAPLVGVLTYIGNTGNAILGGLALFVLGLGSGVPLLIIGTSAGKWLPKSGPWMNGIKIILGVLMLAMAVWLLARIIPSNSRPFSLLHPNQVASSETSNFQTIKGISDLRQALIQAKQQHKPVLVDFYANWCLSCKEMERIVFTAPQVKSLMSHFILLRADVTANDDQDKALERQFHVIAPPTFLFFTPNGQELKDSRIVGQEESQTFANHLRQILASK